MSQNLPSKLIDQPSFLFNNFAGYQNFTDKTVMPFNVLTYPSKNCTVPSFDKVLPDKGKTLYGQIFNENVGMEGNKQKFKNAGGIEMEVRVFKSASANLLDVIQIGYDNNRLVFSTLVGAFTVGESLSGQTSGATATITAIVGTVLFLKDIVGTFVVPEALLGQTSGATAVTVRVPETLFHQITQNINPIPRGVHEYYFDTWFDTALNNSTNSTTVNSKNLPRLVWVNGYKDPTLTGPNTPNTRKGAVYSWTGGVAVITSFVVNTSISINPLTTWRSLGFTEDALGNSFIIVNGVSYQLSNTANLDTSTILVASTAGISIGDTATSQIETDITPIPFDVCRQVKGYMYYGNWEAQQLYQSNGFNRTSAINITAFQGGLLNDLTLNPASPYTGTTESVFHVVIDTVNPPINIQEFIPTGNGINDARFTGTAGAILPSGYTGAPGITNVYKVVVVADFVFTYPDIGQPYNIGEIVVGATSGATARVVAEEVANVGGTFLQLAVVVLSGVFLTGENIVGQDSGSTNPTASSVFNNWIQYYVNDIQTPLISALFTGPTVPIIDSGSYPPVATVITLTDGLEISFGNAFGHAIGDTFKLTINQGGIDTFQWQKDGGVLSASTPITLGFQALSDGVQIKFLNLTGHSVGDYWDITASPAVIRAWDNFYYALPVRRPGEGYIYQLPSNFWTMDTQEDSMYVNTSYGEWSVVQTQLSADLLSEAVSLTPLKQTGANKVLYPYLTGHINDDLVYINTEKNLDTLGRQQFLEKPQTGYLSDSVKLDFQASSFVGGRIKYLGKKLYVSSPENAMLHCYDTFKKYWQPPKTFPEVGLLTIIGDELACHSNIRNQSYTLFTNNAGDDSGEMSMAYPVDIRTPYWSAGSRWNSKQSNMSFIEGYMTGAPKLTHTVYLGINGCGGILPHDVEPILCVAPDRSPFGEGSFGSHSFGSDLDVGGDHFAEIWKKYSPVMNYYFVSLGLSCVTKSHTWSLLGMGLNSMYSLNGNNQLIAPSNLVINNP